MLLQGITSMGRLEGGQLSHHEAGNLYCVGVENRSSGDGCHTVEP